MMRRSRISVRPTVRPGARGPIPAEEGPASQEAARGDSPSIAPAPNPVGASSPSPPNPPAEQPVESAIVSSPLTSPSETTLASLNDARPSNVSSASASALQRRKRISATPNLARPKAVAATARPSRAAQPAPPEAQELCSTQTPDPDPESLILVEQDSGSVLKDTTTTDGKMAAGQKLAKTSTACKDPDTTSSSSGHSASQQRIASEQQGLVEDSFLTSQRCTSDQPDSPSGAPPASDVTTDVLQLERVDGTDSPLREKPQHSDKQKILNTLKLKALMKLERRKVNQSSRRRRMTLSYDTELDRSKMTMRDFIYYLPDSNPMKTKLTEPEEKSQADSRPPSSPRLPLETPDDMHEDEEEEEEAANEEMLVPKVKVAEDGSLILDEESLMVRVQRPDCTKLVEDSTPLFERGSTTTYKSFRKNITVKQWSLRETDMFFLAISMVGTDFSLICHLFPHRCRTEIKNKFKREEKENSWRIDKAFRKKQTYDREFFSALLEKVLARDKEDRQKSKRVTLVLPKAPRKPRGEKKAKQPNKKRSVDKDVTNELDDGDTIDAEKENEDLSNTKKAKPSSATRGRRKRRKNAESGEPSTEAPGKGGTNKGGKRKKSKKGISTEEESVEDESCHGDLDADMAESDSVFVCEADHEDHNASTHKRSSKHPRKGGKEMDESEEERQASAPEPSKPGKRKRSKKPQKVQPSEREDDPEGCIIVGEESDFIADDSSVTTERKCKRSKTDHEQQEEEPLERLSQDDPEGHETVMDVDASFEQPSPDGPQGSESVVPEPADDSISPQRTGSERSESPAPSLSERRAEEEADAETDSIVQEHQDEHMMVFGSKEGSDGESQLLQRRLVLELTRVDMERDPSATEETHHTVAPVQETPKTPMRKRQPSQSPEVQHQSAESSGSVSVTQPTNEESPSLQRRSPRARKPKPNLTKALKKRSVTKGKHKGQAQPAECGNEGEQQMEEALSPVALLEEMVSQESRYIEEDEPMEESSSNVSSLSESDKMLQIIPVVVLSRVEVDTLQPQHEPSEEEPTPPSVSLIPPPGGRSPVSEALGSSVEGPSEECSPVKCTEGVEGKNSPLAAFTRTTCETPVLESKNPISVSTSYDLSPKKPTPYCQTPDKNEILDMTGRAADQSPFGPESDPPIASLAPPSEETPECKTQSSPKRESKQQEVSTELTPVVQEVLQIKPESSPPTRSVERADGHIQSPSLGRAVPFCQSPEMTEIIAIVADQSPCGPEPASPIASQIPPTVRESEVQSPPIHHATQTEALNSTILTQVMKEESKVEGTPSTSSEESADGNPTRRGTLKQRARFSKPKPNIGSAKRAVARPKCPKTAEPNTALLEELPRPDGSEREHAGDEESGNLNATDPLVEPSGTLMEGAQTVMTAGFSNQSHGDLLEEEPSFILTLYEIPVSELAAEACGREPRHVEASSYLPSEEASQEPPIGPGGTSSDPSAAAPEEPYMVLISPLVPISEEMEMEGEGEIDLTEAQETHKDSAISFPSGQRIEEEIDRTECPKSQPKNHPAISSQENQTTASTETSQPGTSEVLNSPVESAAQELDEKQAASRKTARPRRRGKLQMKPTVPKRPSTKEKFPESDHPDLGSTQPDPQIPQPPPAAPLACSPSSDPTPMVSEELNRCEGVSHMGRTVFRTPVGEEMAEESKMDWADSFPKTDPLKDSAIIMPESQEVLSQGPCREVSQDLPSLPKSVPEELSDSQTTPQKTKTRRGKMQVKPRVPKRASMKEKSPKSDHLDLESTQSDPQITQPPPAAPLACSPSSDPTPMVPEELNQSEGVSHMVLMDFLMPVGEEMAEEEEADWTEPLTSDPSNSAFSPPDSQGALSADACGQEKSHETTSPVGSVEKELSESESVLKKIEPPRRRRGKLQVRPKVSGRTQTMEKTSKYDDPDLESAQPDPQMPQRDPPAPLARSPSSAPTLVPEELHQREEVSHVVLMDLLVPVCEEMGGNGEMDSKNSPVNSSRTEESSTIIPPDSKGAPPSKEIPQETLTHLPEESPECPTTSQKCKTSSRRRGKLQVKPNVTKNTRAKALSSHTSEPVAETGPQISQQPPQGTGLALQSLSLGPKELSQIPETDDGAESDITDGAQHQPRHQSTPQNKKNTGSGRKPKGFLSALSSSGRGPGSLPNLLPHEQCTKHVRICLQRIEVETPPAAASSSVSSSFSGSPPTHARPTALTTEDQSAGSLLLFSSDESSITTDAVPDNEPSEVSQFVIADFFTEVDGTE